jgi:hypothetical protein
MSKVKRNVCERLVNLTKDQKALCLSVQSSLNETEAKTLNEYLAKIENNYEPANKKTKLSLDNNEDEFIEQLKTNIKNNLSKDQIVVYKPTELGEINKIQEFNVNVEEDSNYIRSLHSKVVQNETKAYILVLHEANMRGLFYDKLRSKFKKNDDFLSYCEVNFSISKPTIYRYINLVKLIEQFPSLILSGYGVSKLHQKRNLIRDAAKTDQELNQVLTSGFNGIRAKINIDPDEDLSYDFVDKMNVNSKE